MSAKFLDQAGSVRPGEEIDPEVISNFLRKELPILPGIAKIKQFRGGASNLTYQLDFENATFILRRPPIGAKAKSAHNMHREFDVMQRLKPHYPYIPEMFIYCEDSSLIGADFYVMEKLSGLIPRSNLPKGLNLSAEQVRAMCTSAIDKLVELHQIDYKKAGFEDYYRGDGYVSRQINGWSKRYRKAKNSRCT